jgi:hypothetical protein
MAYMNQERKQARMPEIKRVLKKYGVKGSVSVRNHSTLTVTVTEGSLDILGNFFVVYTKKQEIYPERYRSISREDLTSIDVNHYYIDRDYSGKVKDFLEELKSAMLGKDYYDRSDIQSDYFDCSHYIAIDIGKWNKPYKFVA